jgi:hypothetical protein
LIQRAPLISSDSITARHAALDVAVAVGARRIVLLGMDCRCIEIAGRRRSHCHSDYPAQWSDELYSDVILPMWKGWGERMRKRGIGVVNATPGSAIKEFSLVPLDAG